MIFKAVEKETEERLWQKWLVELPNMDEKTFIPFEKYKNNHLKKQNETNLSDEEILEDAESILKMMSKPK